MVERFNGSEPVMQSATQVLIATQDKKMSKGMHILLRNCGFRTETIGGLEEIDPLHQNLCKKSERKVGPRFY